MQIPFRNFPLQLYRFQEFSAPLHLVLPSPIWLPFSSGNYCKNPAPSVLFFCFFVYSAGIKGYFAFFYESFPHTRKSILFLSSQFCHSCQPPVTHHLLLLSLMQHCAAGGSIPWLTVFTSPVFFLSPGQTSWFQKSTGRQAYSFSLPYSLFMAHFSWWAF